MSARILTETFAVPWPSGMVRKAERTRTHRACRHHPKTSKIENSPAKAEFLLAIDVWRTCTHRHHTMPEVLGIAGASRIDRSLGYTRNIMPIDLNCDWRDLRDEVGDCFVGHLKKP